MSANKLVKKNDSLQYSCEIFNKLEFEEIAKSIGNSDFMRLYSIIKSGEILNMSDREKEDTLYSIDERLYSQLNATQKELYKIADNFIFNDVDVYQSINRIKELLGAPHSMIKLYHGSPHKFERYESSAESRSHRPLGDGVYFTTNYNIAKNYAIGGGYVYSIEVDVNDLLSDKFVRQHVKESWEYREAVLKEGKIGVFSNMDNLGINGIQVCLYSVDGVDAILDSGDDYSERDWIGMLMLRNVSGKFIFNDLTS